MKFSKENRDAFNKLFTEVSNSLSKNTSKKNEKGESNAEKVLDCKKVSIKKGAGINVRDYKDFAKQQWEESAECLEKLIKDETATEWKDIPLHFACLVGVGDIIKLFEEIETELYQKGEAKREKISDEIKKEREKMFGTLERRNLPKLEGKVWNMEEIRKKDPSLIKRDLDEACGEMMKRLNKWGGRKFA